MEKFRFRKINDYESPPLDFLYLTDPSKEVVADCLQRRSCYADILEDVNINIAIRIHVSMDL